MAKDKKPASPSLGGQKGVSLMITSFIMIIILSVVLSVSTILYSQLKIVRNIGDSVVSFYAADSGIEKVLYYDRRVMPVIGQDSQGNDILAERGLCLMYDTTNAPTTACPNSGSGLNSSVECNNTTSPQPLAVNGCNSNVCDNCIVSFDTTFNGKSYSVTAKVQNDPYLFDIQSTGEYNNVVRKIEIFSTSRY